VNKKASKSNWKNWILFQFRISWYFSVWKDYPQIQGWIYLHFNEIFR